MTHPTQLSDGTPFHEPEPEQVAHDYGHVRVLVTRARSEHHRVGQIIRPSRITDAQMSDDGPYESVYVYEGNYFRGVPCCPEVAEGDLILDLDDDTFGTVTRKDLNLVYYQATTGPRAGHERATANYVIARPASQPVESSTTVESSTAWDQQRYPTDMVKAPLAYDSRIVGQQMLVTAQPTRPDAQMGHIVTATSLSGFSEFVGEDRNRYHGVPVNPEGCEHVMVLHGTDDAGQPVDPVYGRVSDRTGDFLAVTDAVDVETLEHRPDVTAHRWVAADKVPERYIVETDENGDDKRDALKAWRRETQAARGLARQAQVRRWDAVFSELCEEAGMPKPEIQWGIRVIAALAVPVISRTVDTNNVLEQAREDMGPLRHLVKDDSTIHVEVHVSLILEDRFPSEQRANEVRRDLDQSVVVGNVGRTFYPQAGGGEVIRWNAEAVPVDVTVPERVIA